MPDIDFAARRPWLDNRLADLEASGARILVIDVDGAPAGFITIAGTPAMIDQLAVDPARQAHGLASMLLGAAKMLSPAGLDLIVNRDNRPARRLYRQHGFLPIADAINPTSGLPTLVMRWLPSASLATSRTTKARG